MIALLRPLLVVWLALLLLLGTTVGLSMLELGRWGPVLNLIIAGAKTLLIATVYMHLAKQTGVVRIFSGVGLVWLLILLTLTLSDYLTRTA